VAAKRSRRAKARSRNPWLRRFKQGLFLLSILFLAVFAAGLALYMPIYRQAVDDASTIEEKLVVRSSIPSEIYASDGKTILYKISNVRRDVVDVNQLPAHVRYAIVAAEDRRFYDHRGVDPWGLFRSVWSAAREGHATQGGSTIDMQLAKLMVNGESRTMQRKLKDIATAQEIEELKTKDQIINLYMNQVYFGEGAWGIQQAAETYFGKSAAKLTIAEAALLARCVRSPSRQNPFHDLSGSIERRDYVLEVMREEGWITQEQYEQALNESPKIDKGHPMGVRYIDPRAGYFVQHVLDVFKEDYPTVDLQAGGYKIVTNLNMSLQLEANRAVQNTLHDFQSWNVTDAAFVMMDSQGRILAEVGGIDYAKRKWNTITSGKRQPGSSFKPFVYACALKNDKIHMGDELSNAAIVKVDPNTGKVWAPKNNGRERIGGSMSLMDAFKNSVNLPAIHTIEMVGPQTVAADANQFFGFTNHFQAYDSLAIGTSEVNPLEMLQAYSVFMLRGNRAKPYPIASVTDPDGKLYPYEPHVAGGVYSAEICEDIDQLMRGCVEEGTGYAAHDVPDARGKTGTTQDAKDAWFCGYTDGLVGVGWCGNTVWRKGHPKALPMRQKVFGGTVTAQMWAQVMQKAHELHLTNQPPEERIAKAEKERVKPLRGTDSDKADDDPEPPPASTADTSDSNLVPTDDTGLPRTDKTPPPDPDMTPKKTPDSTKAKPDDTPAPSTSKPKETKKDSDDDSEYVTVNVCSETGMLATPYCPSTVPRRFKKGSEPKTPCRLHTGE
jgi:penicillin-binding protein 1A